MKSGLKIALMVAGVACLALPCVATEQALLRNGFAIEHERRIMLADGRITRLFLTLGDDSFVDVRTSDISSIDKVEQASVKSPKIAPVRKLASAKAARPLLSNSEISEIVNEASDHQQIDPELIRSVIRAESHFNTNAVSKKGARGLMQLMPATALNLGVTDSFDARENVMGGTRYLRTLLAKFDYDLIKALAAYNAGSARVEQYKGVPPYRETRAYVAQIVREFNKAKIAERRLLAAASRAPSSAKAVANPSKIQVQPSTPVHE